MPPLPPTPAPKVRVAATGDGAEMIETLEIQPGRDRLKKVAMSLGPARMLHSRLPDLRPGDLLLASAELEVTTDLSKHDPQNSVGKAYRYAPYVRAWFVLADSDTAVGPAGKTVPVGPVVEARCTHRRHHTVIVLDDVPYPVPAGGLPFSGQAHLNLVISASNPHAAKRQLLLIGQNNPGGKVEGDMGAISVVRLRPAEQRAPAVAQTTQRLATSLRVVKGKKVAVYSLPLPGLSKGEQLVVKSELHTSAAKLGYPARATTRVFLADSQTQVEPGGAAARIASSKGKICRRNGFNCLAAEDPGVTRKAGVLRILKRARKPTFVNVVLETGDPERKAKRGDVLRIRPGGSLSVVRYPPECEG